MLQLKNICKSYTTGNFTQKALDDVSISFRDNEFVAVLGPSGSGKTTMLNIVGGLDHYDSGDLIIDGVSTKKYKDRDWDTYRNNRVGFVFQSYNLIPHQTVLANVELALTLSGVSRAERRKRAEEALVRVGLGDHMDKKPSQMSGGQMQRVAIARALINNPEILLADEPTGALDSKTSVQIMDLLTEIADDRLVVMVTHNPELAEQYATRIVTLTDGSIRDDTDPYEPSESEIAEATAKPARRTSMSFLTALSLSANNLMTKKGRTIMTAIAGSIGIIGIAAILALANGVNNYIKNVEEETLSVYPLQIMSTGFDFTSMLVGMGGNDNSAEEGSTSGEEPSNSEESSSSDVSISEEIRGELPEGQVGEARMLTRMFASFGNNDLAALKKYFDSGESGIQDYVNSIYYEYAVTPQIFDANTKHGARQVNPDTSFSSLGFGSGSSTNSIMSMSMSTDVFAEMMENDVVAGQYDVVAGHWPEKKNELVLVLSKTGRINDFMSYVLGLRDSKELKKMVKQFTNEEEVEAPDNKITITYDDILNTKLKLVNATSYYKYDADHEVWVDKTDDKKYMKKLVKNGEDLVIAGIVKPKPEAKATALTMGIYYTPALTRHIVKTAAKSDIVRGQLDNPKVDVFSGKKFDDLEKESKDSFDMSSLFEIDEEAITAAFTFDASALDFSNMDFSSIDLSSMDMSKMDLRKMKLPEMDLSEIDTSGLDLSNLNIEMPTMSAEDIAKMFPEIKADEIVSGISVKFKGDDDSAVQELVTGLAQWSAQQAAMGNYDPDINEYFQTEEGTKALAAVGDSIDTDDLQSQVSTAIAKQLGTTPDKVESVITQRISEYYSKELGGSLQKQLSSAISDYFTKTLSVSLTKTMQEYIAQVMEQVMQQVGSELEAQIKTMMENAFSNLAENIGSAMGFDEEKFKDAFKFKMDEDELAELMTSMLRVEEHSYDNNLKKLGYADFEKPSEISIYPRDFESKEHVIAILDGYNDKMRADDEDKVISYTDIVGTLMESVTTIVNMISYVLIAFVAISLIVSSIMIGVITYISVLERKKEIGILRSIGASKGDISRVFNAETVIEGLIAGLLGVGVTALACIPANIIVYNLFDVPDLALLPMNAAAVLVAISVVLTFVAGLIPSGSASRKDPVEALRSE